MKEKVRIRQLNELKTLVNNKNSSPKKKRVRITAPATNKKKTVPATEKDIDFPRTMLAQNVKPLPPSRRTRIEKARAAPIPRQRRLDEKQALTLAKFGPEPASTQWDIGQEWENDQFFLRPGMSPDVLRKLRRGYWTVQAEMDLHGMISDEAHDALLDFLIHARQRGLRCVRIVHGKGLTSPGKTPVLKGKVRRWLMLWNDVLAYCEPTHHGGGGGAVMVLLRGR